MVYTLLKMLAICQSSSVIQAKQIDPFKLRQEIVS